jgi:hypothetical protein
VTRNTPRVVIVLAAVIGVAALVLVPAALADKGGNGGGKSSTTASSTTTTATCASAPRAYISNTWAWGASGSWGLPGQQLGYHVYVVNDDVGCGSSSFVISVSAPDGFSVSIPTSTITLNSASSGYLWAYVTSPSGIADGDYTLTVTVARAGTSSPTGSSTSSYKVYSSDTAAPKLYWTNPSDGGALSGRSAYVGFASSDDHVVRQLDLSLDGVSVASTLCSTVSYECQLSYNWSIRRVRGQHTATYKSTDWVGNVATRTVTFTVN